MDSQKHTIARLLFSGQNVKIQITVAERYLSLITNKAEHIDKYLLPTHVAYSEKCISRISSIFIVLDPSLHYSVAYCEKYPDVIKQFNKRLA